MVICTLYKCFIVLLLLYGCTSAIFFFFSNFIPKDSNNRLANMKNHKHRHIDVCTLAPKQHRA